MTLKAGGGRQKVLLDWFNISYRSIVMAALVVLVSAAGLLGFYYYHAVYQQSPRHRAASAITAAERLLDQASSVAAGDEGQELKQSAQRLLAEARRRFDSTNYEDAARSAEQSQMSSQRLLALMKGEAARAAQFYKIEGDVRVKRARELVWVRATKGMSLSVGDQIKTDSRSAAQIIYFNGTITTVTPGSILEIKELYENPSTRVQQVRERLREGRVASITQEPAAEGSFHEIATQNTVAVTEERTSLEVAFNDQEQKTRLEVHSGRAHISTGGGYPSVDVEPQERIEVDKEAQVSEAVKLPPAPPLDAPVDQKVIPLGESSETAVHLSWREVPEASSYHLQISGQSLFSTTLVDQTLETPAATLPRSTEGNYYWRVAAVFPDGTEGPMSEVRKFKVVPGDLALRGDSTPPVLEIEDFLVFSTQVIVRGKTEPGALLAVNGVRIDVYDDGTFTSVIPLQRAGRQTLSFVAQDIAGNAARLERVAEVDTY